MLGSERGLENWSTTRSMVSHNPLCAPSAAEPPVVLYKQTCECESPHILNRHPRRDLLCSSSVQKLHVP